MFDAYPVLWATILGLFVLFVLIRFVLLKPLLSFAQVRANRALDIENYNKSCLLYTSPSPRDQRGSRMPSSA